MNIGWLTIKEVNNAYQHLTIQYFPKECLKKIESYNVNNMVLLHWDGNLLGIGGIEILNQGEDPYHCICEAWALPTIHFQKYYSKFTDLEKFRLVRCCKEAYNYLIKKLNPTRVHAFVEIDENVEKNSKFCKFLGMEYEATFRKFSPRNLDCKVFAQLLNDSSIQWKEYESCTSSMVSASA